MSESIFLSFGLISHLRWHQGHLTLEWLRAPHNKEREARVWETAAIGKVQIKGSEPINSK